MPKIRESAFERPNLRWDDPPAGRIKGRPAKLIALSLGLAFTFAGGVAAAMLTLDRADAEGQVRGELPQQAQVAPVQAVAAGPAPAAEPELALAPQPAPAVLPIKKVKTVTVLAKAGAAPVEPKAVEPVAPVEAPAAPDLAAQSSPAPAPMDLNRLVAPAKERWARNLAAVQAGSAAIDEESRTSAAIDQARFAAVAMLPLVTEPVLEAPLAAPDEQPAEESEAAAEPKKSQRKARMAQSANLRARPANGGKRLATLSAGTSLVLHGCGKGWCEVSADGQRCFVAERFLKGKAAPSKRKKAARKRKAKPAPAATPVKAEAAPAEKLPGVFPKPAIPAPSDR